LKTDEASDLQTDKARKKSLIKVRIQLNQPVRSETTEMRLRQRQKDGFEPNHLAGLNG
jgi:hypothetical protein